MRPLTLPFIVSISLLTSILTVQTRAAEVAIADPSFEDLPAGTSIGGTTVFGGTGVWTIDMGSIRAAENGIVPLDGSQMLRFTEVAPHVTTNIYQLIDVSTLAGPIELSAFVNATAQHEMYISILAYEEASPPLDVGAYEDSASSGYVTTDGDPATWEELTLEYQIPPTANYIAIGLDSDVGATASYADKISIRCTCPDLDGDGVVGVTDLLDLLGNWGPCPGCAADLNSDGVVSTVDLLELLGSWGGC